jgi:hypothetical protein
MGSSAVKYRGKGFWSYDRYLEDALALMAEAIDPETPESWLTDARRHWSLMSTGIFLGCVYPDFDEIVTSESREKTVLALLESALSRSDLTPEARATLQLMSKLILGELDLVLSSPLDYMVSREHPYRKMRTQPAMGL